MRKDKRINILHLRDSPWVDGPGRTILESASRINTEKYGYFIGAFCSKNSQGNPFIDTAVGRKLKVFRIDESHSLDWTILSQIKHLIVREKVDIIHTHEVRSDLFGLVAGKLAGVPVMTTLHGWIENGLKGKLFTRIDKGMLRFFDHVIAVSEKMKDEVLRFSVKPEKVSVLRNALVIENFRRNSEDRSFRGEIGVNGETLLVGNIGRLSPEKGQADFIRSAAKVISRHQDARFVLIGIGDDKPHLEALSRSLGLDGKVLFLGYRGDMTRIYNSLDLVVQSSFTEGMPNVVLEALAMEVAVIATDVGGTSEVIKNNETGVLVCSGRHEIIAEKILNYTKNRTSFKKMAANGRKLVETSFNFDERTSKLSDVYDWVIAGGIKKANRP